MVYEIFFHIILYKIKGLPIITLNDFRRRIIDGLIDERLPQVNRKKVLKIPIKGVEFQRKLDFNHPNNFQKEMSPMLHKS